MHRPDGDFYTEPQPKRKKVNRFNLNIEHVAKNCPRAVRRFNFHFHEWYTALLEMFEWSCVHSVSVPVQEKLEILERQIQDLQLLVEELFRMYPDSGEIPLSDVPTTLTS